MKTSTLLLLGGAAVVGYLYATRKAAGSASGTTQQALSAQAAQNGAMNQISYELDDIRPEWGWVQPVWGGASWGGFRGGGGHGHGGHGHGGHGGHGGHH